MHDGGSVNTLVSAWSMWRQKLLTCSGSDSELAAALTLGVCAAGNGEGTTTGVIGDGTRAGLGEAGAVGAMAAGGLEAGDASWRAGAEAASTQVCAPVTLSVALAWSESARGSLASAGTGSAPGPSRACAARRERGGGRTYTPANWVRLPYFLRRTDGARIFARGPASETSACGASQPARPSLVLPTSTFETSASGGATLSASWAGSSEFAARRVTLSFGTTSATARVLARVA